MDYINPSYCVHTIPLSSFIRGNRMCIYYKLGQGRNSNTHYRPFWLVALYLVGAQLNNVEDEPGTMDAGESQESSLSSLDQPQAFLGSSLLHQVINDLEEYISHPAGQNSRFKAQDFQSL